jgi:hypothetical protein
VDRTSTKTEFSATSHQRTHPAGPSVTGDPAAGGPDLEGDVGSVRPAIRPSIPPERLARALPLQIFYSIRSERMLMEQLDYNLLFR